MYDSLFDSIPARIAMALGVLVLIAGVVGGFAALGTFTNHSWVAHQHAKQAAAQAELAEYGHERALQDEACRARFVGIPTSERNAVYDACMGITR